MKESWIIGVFALYLVIMAWEMIATGGSSLNVAGNYAIAGQSTLISPDLAKSSEFWLVIGNILGFLESLIKVLMLWAPTVFSGTMIWFWWFVCFPVDAGMVWGIVKMVRGT
jgi:hypothetical protein